MMCLKLLEVELQTNEAKRKVYEILDFLVVRTTKKSRINTQLMLRVEVRIVRFVPRLW